MLNAELKWSPQQLSAIEAVNAWRESEEQIFRLFGFAGTGKTTLAKHLVESVEGRILWAAYTGKAALVMRKHGLPARTIHQTIYLLEPPNAKEYSRLREALKRAEGKEKAEIAQSMKELRQPQFVLNYESFANEAALIVLDEVSMVYDEMALDLLSFNVPVLVLGDPGQLPPIRGTGYFTETKPDIMLTEIHRQAEGNPIISLATKARKGEAIALGEYGSSRVISRQDWPTEAALSTDQILVGKNQTRRAVNRRMRRLKGFDSPYPQVGERLICLKNDHTQGLLNGMQAVVVEVGDIDAFSLPLKLEVEDGRTVDIDALLCHFDEYEKEGAIEEFETSYPFWVRKGKVEFDFAYAITVHKAQGSQWDHVTLFDDRFGRDFNTRCRWLYTAITRAAETITVVR